LVYRVVLACPDLNSSAITAIVITGNIDALPTFRIDDGRARASSRRPLVTNRSNIRRNRRYGLI